MLNIIMLLGTILVILLAVGWVIGGILGMTVALIISILINFFSYWYSDKIILKLYKAVKTDDKKLNEMVKKLSRETRIPKPAVYIAPMNTSNAMATGRNPENSAVIVTKGLLKLNDDEIEGVLAHEIAHIRNRDVLVSTLAATIGGAISYLAQIGYWSIFLGGDNRNEGNMMGLILIIIFAPLAVFLIRMAISRDMEYRADNVGALITKKPGALASALKKISKSAVEHPLRGSNATSHMWIVNPFKKDWFSGLFSTHPPIGKRVAILEDMAAKGI